MPQPYLPDNDPNPTKRSNDLIKRQQAYQYEDEYLYPLALLKQVPSVESFSSQYITERIEASAKLVPNMLKANAKSFFDPLDDLQDYEDLFNLLPLPEVAKVYQTDHSFAEQRLSGVNPLVIRLLDQDDARAEVLKSIPSADLNFEPMFVLSKELENGNIYIADYTGTDPKYRGPSVVWGGSHDKGRKYLPKPLAFFWWKKIGIRDRGKLVPIAIQLEASTDREKYVQSTKPVYTPFEKNPLNWLFAKFCVQIADGNHHEMNSHLCRTHFVMEPIAIGTARQLSRSHPLSILLRPHFLFMLANNHLGQERLINAGGSVDELLAGTLGESLELVKDAYSTWDINEFAFPKEIKNRGMDKIPHYPYRDDGQLIWDAIHTFVSSYLNHFYPSSDLIAGDSELQAWASELSDQIKGGKVKGMPPRILDVNQLIEIVTTVIFTCGPKHSAVNFAQYDYMAFAANMPLAAYQNPEDLDSNEPITEEKILALLPPYKRTVDQLQALFVLSAYRYDKLGYYDRAFKQLYNEKVEDSFVDDNAAVIDIIDEFKKRLNEVEQKIDNNNLKRAVPYPYLKPSLILNSISI